MLDSNLLLIKQTAAAAVADSPIEGTGKLLGESLVPECYMTYVPAVAATTTPKMVVTIEESDALASGYTTLSSREITAAGVYFDTVISNKAYRRAVLTITGTSADFGLVVVGRVPAGRYTNK